MGGFAGEMFYLLLPRLSGPVAGEVLLSCVAIGLGLVASWRLVRRSSLAAIPLLMVFGLVAGLIVWQGIVDWEWVVAGWWRYYSRGSF